MWALDYLRLQMFYEKIEPHSSSMILTFLMWRYVFNGPVTTSDEQRDKIKHIFGVFIKMERLNGLEGTPAVTALESALVTLGEEGEFEGTPGGNWKKRISQREVVEINGDLKKLGCPGQDDSDPGIIVSRR